MDEITQNQINQTVIPEVQPKKTWKTPFIIVSCIACLLILVILYLLTLGRKTDIPCGGFVGSQCPLGYSCKYENNYPDALGYCVKNIFPFNQKNSSPKPTIIPSPIPTFKPTITQESTTDWKTCENQTYNFSIQYPPDLYIDVPQKTTGSKTENCLVFEPTETLRKKQPLGLVQRLSISVSKNSNNLPDDPYKLFDIGPGSSSKFDDFVKVKEVSLGNNKAYQVDNCCGGYWGMIAMIVALKDNNIYEIHIETWGNFDYDKTVNENIYKQMLSTFKFLDNPIDINIPGTESSLSGIIRKTASRPSPDIPYDYEIVLDKPLTGITSGAGENQTMQTIIIEGKGLNFDSYVNKHINFLATLEWGLAESRVLQVTKILDSN